ncbi:hypothetical protein KKG90_04000 [Candidatus Bipolaricaulota bacterium]|nr:hypothetical protein [Candidatus Bipolaricaulota bacterium]
MESIHLNQLSTCSLDVRWIGERSTNGITTSNLTFQAAMRQRRAASLVRPEGDGPFPVILYVHWYEPAAANSNRTQFLEEAQTMAQCGAMSLLIEAAWSDREWFLKRTQQDDYAASVSQVSELRRAIDLLLAQPGADARRVAYVGHDFGAMYGVVAGSLDRRPSCYVLMAGTPRFPDWFLYYPELQEDEREAFIRQMQPLDPIGHVGRLSPAPILFQFGVHDPHVPLGRATAFADAADEPKQVQTYEAGHALNEQAKQDRMAWLRQQLAI